MSTTDHTGVLREGFARFLERLREVGEDEDDPVAELFALCRAYREFALAEPDVYAVLFGGSGLSGFQPGVAHREMGLYVLRVPNGAIQRAVAAGRFRPADEGLLVRRLWCLLHGMAELERTGYLPGRYGHRAFLDAAVRDFAVGAGDTFEAATASGAFLEDA
ncbi:TetR-like C-terminal domain-containing protein [Streptomyces sp. SID3212]|uniref:WHG domain-containing protein n=1 Tax=unclassified Streptomyces TaxID=2593676 RepID=UPI00136D32F1|nr:hypothetical protein [Streptomyces sp. SID3212]